MWLALYAQAQPGARLDDANASATAAAGAAADAPKQSALIRSLDVWRLGSIWPE